MQSVYMQLFFKVIGDLELHELEKIWEQESYPYDSIQNHDEASINDAPMELELTKAQGQKDLYQPQNKVTEVHQQEQTLNMNLFYGKQQSSLDGEENLSEAAFRMDMETPRE